MDIQPGKEARIYRSLEIVQCPRCKREFMRRMFKNQKIRELCMRCRKNDRQSNPTRPIQIMEVYRRSAKLRGLKFNLTIEDFKQFWQKNCYYCGEPLKRVAFDRLDSSEGYVKGNVVPCCIKCNRAKNDLSMDEFMSMIEKIYLNHIHQENLSDYY